MRGLISLAWRSLRARCFTASLTVIAVALSVMLLLASELLRKEARDSFQRGIAGTDLIVGARSHPVQLLLYSVFRLGDASNNLSWASAQWLADQPDVDWMVPVSLGDSHRGFRVIGTSSDYFNRIGVTQGEALAFANGAPFTNLFDAVVGAEVAHTLGYEVGDSLVLAHGTARVATQAHEDRPFILTGILAATGTAIDQGVYVSLPALEAIHLNWRSGTRVGQTPDLSQLTDERLQPRTVTALLVGLKSKVATFAVQRAVNDFKTEPLSAILPGVALQQLWSMLGTIEHILTVAALCVVAAGFMVLLTTILSTLNERRREMAVLRSVGAGARHVFGLLVVEAASLALAGATLGLLLVQCLFAFAEPALQIRYGLFIAQGLSPMQALVFLASVAGLGAGIGLLPALLAYRRSIQDGMTIKF